MFVRDVRVAGRQDPAAFNGMKKVNINVGDLFASDRPMVMQTLLGSCVAACLYDPTTGIGGMNHILLPGRSDSNHFDESTRYGINAMELLINRMMKLGVKRRRLMAKVFGGGHIIRGINEGNSPGYRNAEFLMDFLDVEKIPVVSRDIGGYNARRVYFRTDTGDVYLKKVPSLKLSIIAARESHYRKRAESEVRRAGNVVLFIDTSRDLDA